MLTALLARQLSGVVLIAEVGMNACAAGQAALHTVYRSLDGGRSWSRSDAGLPGNSRINALTTVGDSVFAGTDSGIFVSADGGRNWRLSADPAARTNRFTCFASPSEVLYAGSDRLGVIASFDHGRTWLANRALGGRNVRCLIALQDTLYAGTDTEGVFASKDHGQSWTRLERGLPPQCQIFTLSAVNDRLFAGLYSKGLYSWDASKQVWINTSGVSPLVLTSIGDTLVAGHNPGGLFWSSDAGRTWRPGTSGVPAANFLEPESATAELPTNAPVWSLEADGNRVFAGASAGIYFSQDRGRTWTRATAGLPPATPGIAFLVRGNLVLAATLIQGATGEPRASEELNILGPGQKAPD